MRELGARLSPSGSNKPERETRIAAANKGWNQLQFFWTSPAPYRVKRIAFITRVLAAALSGLEALAFTPADANAIDTSLVKKLRTMMCGKACGWGPRGVLHPMGRRIAMSDAAVWRFWRLAPSAVELAVRRVKWYQQWLRAPEQNKQIISKSYTSPIIINW